MTSPTRCERCGAPLTTTDAGAVCPACLLGVAVAAPSQLSAPEAGSSGPLSDPLAATVEHTPSPSAAPRETPPTRLPEPGERFGNYQIVRLLGKGGMGAVYEAEQLDSGRRVALKVLKQALDTPEARKRFFREGRLAAQINHPHSVYVYGTEEVAGTPVITMELVSGGTLQERVARTGPLPIGEAVDAVLQVIAGLEAAQQLGVLHRDVKPANCFVDVDGTVKVGDFGLSISTGPRAEFDVTTSGSFLGTPAFASPEQLRGDDLNARSDIYSVGVTLYYLLTGRTPFQADNLVKLLATVLEQSPKSPRELRPELPPALAAIVLRCLAKQPDERFADYASLRQALLPFASAAPRPGSPGLRLLAYLVDSELRGWAMLPLQLGLFGNYYTLAEAAWSKDARGVELLLTGIASHLILYGLIEGYWGLTPGKALCGLRVANARREPPGILVGLARAIITLVPGLVVWLIRLALPREAYLNLLPWLSVVPLAGLGLMFLTARRSNGWASVYDLWTGTRVVARTVYESRPALAAAAEPAVDVTQASTVGPYHVLEVLERSDRGSWLLGYDPRLLRRVWIRQSLPGAPPVAEGQRQLARRGRLRWLQSQRTADAAWDAYEAPSGQALVELVARRQPWKAVRYWLADLAEELHDAAESGTLPEKLALDRVWITADGRAKLLDFPAPGRAEPAAAAVTAAAPTPQVFLNQVARSALEGRAVAPRDAAAGPPAVPLPLRARAGCERLLSAAPLREARDTLRDLTTQRAEVGRGVRTWLVLGPLLPAIIISVFLGTVMPLMLLDKETRDFQTTMGFWQAVKKATDKETTAPANDEQGLRADDLRALEIYIVSHYGSSLDNPHLSPLRMISQNHYERDLRELVAKYPAISDAERQQAEIRVKALRAKMQDAGFDAMLWRFVGFFVAVAGVFLAACMGVVCVVAAGLFRGGLMWHALGIDAVLGDGRRAPRWRLVARSLIGWGPILSLPLMLYAVRMPRAFYDDLPMIVAVGAATLSLLAFASAWDPERGLSDRLAGTWLVRR